MNPLFLPLLHKGILGPSRFPQLHPKLLTEKSHHSTSTFNSVFNLHVREGVKNNLNVSYLIEPLFINLLN